MAEVAATVTETPRTRTLVLDVQGWGGHRAGQHLDVRLTSEDGYQAERSYSIASAPDDRSRSRSSGSRTARCRPTSSTWCATVTRFEVRGPIGGYFVWEPGDERPVLLIGGGSGVVPLMAMAARASHGRLGRRPCACSTRRGRSRT